jgi:hypothetical protein
MANRPNAIGFRWVRSKAAPTSEPPRETRVIASAYATSLGRGAPVKIISDGTIQLAATNDAVYGVFDGMAQNYNASTGFVGPAPKYTATVTYSSDMSRQSRAYVIPVVGQVFRITCDDNTTATTQAAYEAFVQENCDFSAGTAAGDRSGHVADISTHATTAEDLRILAIPDIASTDFSATGVEIEVEFNLIQGTQVGSTTGT